MPDDPVDEPTPAEETPQPTGPGPKDAITLVSKHRGDS